MSNYLKKHLLKITSFLIASSGLSNYLMLRKDAISSSIINTIKSGGQIDLPEDVQFEITMRCNLKCAMCHQTQRRIDSQGDLSIADIRKVIDNLVGIRIRRVKLIGGEVFVRKDILEIISAFEKHKIGVSITTNGTLLNNNILSELGNCSNLLGMVFSIDGMEVTHESIRGIKGCFPRTVGSMRKAARFLNMTKVTCVLQENNLHEVEQMIASAKEWKVDILAFLLESFSTETDIAATRRMLQELGAMEFFLSPSKTECYEFTFQKLMETCRLIRQSAARAGIVSYLGPPAAAAYPQLFYSGDILSQNKLVTCGYLNRLIITESGEVLACPFIDLRFGNLLSQSIEEIWHSKMFKTYRELFVSKGPFPICRRCCALTVFR